jgi:hypothetical protein
MSEGAVRNKGMIRASKVAEQILIKERNKASMIWPSGFKNIKRDETQNKIWTT